MKYIGFVFLVITSYIGYAQPSGYGYGKQITINSSQVAGTSNFTDFPILVEVIDNDLRTTGNGGRIENSNGYDIIFTTSDCNTVLDHQIEEYTGSNGEIIFWVRIPTLNASTNTLIHMYYGNSSANTDPSVETVWDANFTGVYHLSNNDLTDAAGSNDCSNNSTSNRGNAKIDGGRTYNNVNDYIECPVTGMSMSTGTVSLWARADAFPSAHQYFYGHTATSGSWASRIQLYTNENTGLLDLGLGDSHGRDVNFYDLNSGEYYFIALTWDNGDYEVYVNDGLEASGTYTGLTTLNTSNEHDIGNDGRGSARDEGFDGRLDEYQFSNVARSGNWLETAYNSQNAPGTFLSFTTEYTAANLCATLPIELLSYSAQRNGNNIDVSWETSSEIDVDYFMIERSLFGDNWETIGQVKGAGTTNQNQMYSIIDQEAPNSECYYRLVENDLNGERINHAVKYISAIETQEKKTIFINRTELGIEVYSKEGVSDLQLIDINGRLVEAWGIESKSIEFSTDSYDSGIYVIKGTSNSKSFAKRVLID